MVVLSKDEARQFLLGHHRLTGFHYDNTHEGLRQLLADLRCIQLDPLSPLGTSPDLVVHARCKDYRMGDLFQKLFPGDAFEHYAKERCLLPAHAFPYYQGYARQRMWPRLDGWLRRSMQKVPQEVLEAVVREVAERGPLSPSDLTGFGKVVPFDWQGWKGTSNAGTLALEILWAWCRVVVCGRKGREKIYGLPAQVLDPWGSAEDGHGPDAFSRWSLVSRVDAAGLLPINAGPHWSMLEDVRAHLPGQLVEEGTHEWVTIAESNRRYLARAGFQNRHFPAGDDHLRILGPLDALLWYRPLIQDVFGFEYIWEVYKPAAERRWGWYVCPLLHQGQLVGRLEAKTQKGVLAVETVWCEAGRELDRDALKLALARHVEALGAERFTLPRAFKKAPV